MKSDGSKKGWLPAGNYSELGHGDGLGNYESVPSRSGVRSWQDEALHHSPLSECMLSFGLSHFRAPAYNPWVVPRW